MDMLLKPTVKFLTALALAGLFGLSAPATAAMPQPPQPQQRKGRPPFNPKEFRKNVEDFITRQAGLTPKEAHDFFPLYHEMKEQQRNVQGKIHRATQRIEKERLTEADCRRIVAQVKKFRQEYQDIEARYFRKFEHILPPSKLLRVMNAEHKFGQEMFRKGPRR